MRALTLTALLSLAAPGSLLAANAWQIDHDESRLGFEATQQGGTFTGEFGQFAADMRFSPDDLAASAFDVTIDVTSIDTGSSQRDRELPGADWFYFEQFPQATYRTTRIRAGTDGYEAVGDLTLRDNTREVVLAFTWDTEGERAQMVGEAVIDRTHFGIGQGDWTDPDAVGHEVRVQVDLELTRGE